MLVTDSSSLIANLASPDVNDYYTLGLVDSAIVVENSEEQEIVLQDVTGLENLVIRIQGEYAYNLSLRGFTWDVGNGAVKPDTNHVDNFGLLGHGIYQREGSRWCLHHDPVDKLMGDGEGHRPF